MKRPVNIKTIEVEVQHVTKYNRSMVSPFAAYAGFNLGYESREEVKHVPVIFKFDGIRFTRVKDERTIREGGYDI